MSVINNRHHSTKDNTDDSLSFGSSTRSINSHELLATKEQENRKRFHLLSHAVTVAVASLHIQVFVNKYN